MRLGLIGGDELGGAARSSSRASFRSTPYMYTVRPFMRMNGVAKSEVEDFVVAVSGKKLSVREIEQLAHGYFRGPESFREEIRRGNIGVAAGADEGGRRSIPTAATSLSGRCSRIWKSRRSTCSG